MGEPTDVAEAAKRRLAELRAETIELEGFLRTYSKLTGQTTAVDSAEQPNETATNPAKIKPSASSRIIGAARDAMMEAGRPLNRVELVQAIEDSGLTIGGTNKGNNLGSMLWRTKLFDSDRNGYWPKGEPKPHSESDFDL